MSVICCFLRFFSFLFFLFFFIFRSFQFIFRTLLSFFLHPYFGFPSHSSVFTLACLDLVVVRAVGADPSQRDAKGWSALRYAVLEAPKNVSEMIDVLVDCGAQESEIDTSTGEVRKDAKICIAPIVRPSSSSSHSVFFLPPFLPSDIFFPCRVYSISQRSTAILRSGWRP